MEQKMKLTAIIFTVLLLLPATLLTGTPAPFDDLTPSVTQKTGAITNVAAPDSKTAAPATDNAGLWNSFIRLSRSLQAELSSLLLQLDKKFSLLHFLLIFLLSAAYGVIHAAGPGHGKILLTTWMLRNEAERADAMKMAAVTSAIHTGSALLLALFFQLILTMVPDGTVQMTLRKVFTVLSGLLVIAVGLYHLYKHRKERESVPEKAPAKAGDRSALLVAAAAGMVPCPLSMSIMFLAFANRVFYLGVISVLGISTGMFLLLFLMSWAVSGSRRGLLHKLFKKEHQQNLIHKLLEYGSGALIVVLGLFLALSQL